MDKLGSVDLMIFELPVDCIRYVDVGRYVRYLNTISKILNEYSCIILNKLWFDAESVYNPYLIYRRPIYFI